MMDILESIYQEARDNNIDIINYHFSGTKKAACIYEKSDHGDIKVIAVDKDAIRSRAEEAVLLYEELGHYETGNLYMLSATYNTPMGRSNHLVCEARTRQWAIRKHLPYEALKKAIQNGYTSLFELAEYFQVTEEFIADALKYYVEDCGLNFNER